MFTTPNAFHFICSFTFSFWLLVYVMQSKLTAGVCSHPFPRLIVFAFVRNEIRIFLFTFSTWTKKICKWNRIIKLYLLICCNVSVTGCYLRACVNMCSSIQTTTTTLRTWSNLNEKTQNRTTPKYAEHKGNNNNKKWW